MIQYERDIIKTKENNTEAEDSPASLYSGVVGLKSDLSGTISQPGLLADDRVWNFFLTIFDLWPINSPTGNKSRSGARPPWF